MTQLQEAIRDKITKYSDACGMCTDITKECNTCGITCILEDLNELQKLADNPDAIRSTAHIMRGTVDHMKEPKLAYRGYTATVEYDEDDKLWHGTLDGIKDLVNFHAFEIENIEKEFRNAVDDYLDFCKEVGKEPERPQMSEWISVKDRLPEKDESKTTVWHDAQNDPPKENGEYLCYYEYFRYGNYYCMYRTIDRGHFFNGQWGGEPTRGTSTKVLKWTELPLPEPPEVTP